MGKNEELQEMEKEIKNPTRQIKGIWIPIEIWENQNISVLARVLFAEISSLDNAKYGACIAGNEYFAKFFGVNSNTISRTIKLLKKEKLIEQISFNGRFRKLKVILPIQKSEADSTECDSNSFLSIQNSEADSTECVGINILNNKINNNNKDSNTNREENGGAVMCMTPKVKKESLLRKNKEEHSFKEKKENVSRNEEEQPMNDFLDDFNNHKKEKYKNAQAKKKENADVLKNVIIEKFGLENLPLVLDYITLHKSFKNGTPQKISFIQNIEDFCPFEKVITTMQKVIDSHTRLKNVSLYGGQWHEWNLKNFSKDEKEFQKKEKFEKKEKQKILARKGKLMKGQDSRFWQSFFWICPECGKEYPGREIGTGLICQCGAYIDINPQEI